ncbi:MAG: hypothetical protein JW944_04035, partial [Deltaproteobacteria bacterium]|nr:hypothetical protein [Deltaproteobacteria bacterium]
EHYNDVSSFWSHSSIELEVNIAMERLYAEYQKYPKIENIKGINMYEQYSDAFPREKFSYTNIEGSITNPTGSYIKTVAVKVELFKKNLSGYLGNNAFSNDLHNRLAKQLNMNYPSGLSDNPLKQFDEAKAGHVEYVDIGSLGPFQTKVFKKTLKNLVPYTYFSAVLCKLNKGLDGTMGDLLGGFDLDKM